MVQIESKPSCSACWPRATTSRTSSTPQLLGTVMPIFIATLPRPPVYASTVDHQSAWVALASSTESAVILAETLQPQRSASALTARRCSDSTYGGALQGIVSTACHRLLKAL